MHTISEKKLREFYDALLKKCSGITESNQIGRDDYDGALFLNSMFSTSKDEEGMEKGVCLFKTQLVSDKTGTWFEFIDASFMFELNEERFLELEKVVLNMNALYPYGCLGIRYADKQMYYRYSPVIDIKKPIKQLVEDSILYYNLMARNISIIYDQAKLINEGEMTYDEAVEKEIIYRQS